MGAGGGEYTRWLAQHCGMCGKAYDVLLPGENPFNLFACDPHNQFSCDHASKWNGLAHAHRASFRVLPFNGKLVPEANGSFDLVVLNSMLHHAATNAPALLREAARVTTRHALVFEDLAVPADAQIMARHRIHDANGTFRTQEEWEELFADAGFRVDMVGSVGSPALSHLKFQKSSRLDWRFQRYFLLHLGSRRKVSANATRAPDPRLRKRRCRRLESRFGPQKCYDVPNASTANFFYVVTESI